MSGEYVLKVVTVERKWFLSYRKLNGEKEVGVKRERERERERE